MIIEDDPDLRDNTAELLEYEGYQVITAKNGMEGYKMVKDHHPDIAVCDILTSESQGLLFLKMVRSDECTSNLPVILLSAEMVPHPSSQVSAPDANEYLPKPFSDIDLLAAIERNLTGHHFLLNATC